MNEDKLNSFPNDPKPLLPYRSGIDERRSRPRVPIWLQVLLGFIISSAVVVVAGGIGGFGAGGHPAGFIVVLFGIAALAAVAFGMNDDPQKRGWQIGLLLGAGIVGLIEGVCFVSIA